jgi:hypothetical protein
MNSEFVAIAGTLLFGISIVSMVVFFDYADLRRDRKLIEEWYTNGPYRAKWTESGILVFDTRLGLPSTSTFCDDVHKAKLSAASRNKTLSRATEMGKLYKQKAGQEIQ